jgi:hypothetical protein
MQFTSIKEYFYKVYSRILFMSLLPIIGFIAVYLQSSGKLHIIEVRSLPLIIAAVSVVTIWTISLISFNKKIKSIRNAQGLREKLEKYFRITIVRYTLFAVCSFALLGIFFVYRNDLLALIFALQLAVCAFVWPTPSKVSDDLALRGDEREMVYYRKDVL